MFYRPVTTEFGSGFFQIQETLEAAHEVSKTDKLFGYVLNVDAGSDDISKGIRMFRDREAAKNSIYKNFTLKIMFYCWQTLDVL